MPIMNTRTFPSALEYVDSAVRTYYQEVADDYKPVFSRVFDVMTTDKAWVQDVTTAGLGPLRRSSEGQAVEFDTLYEGPAATYVLNKFHLGYGVTEDAKIFNKLLPILEAGTKAMAVSVIHSQEMVCADLLNNAFNTTYVGADGKALLATDHPLIRPDAAHISGASTYANRPTIDYGMSEAGLEQMVTDARMLTDDSGFYGGVEPDVLVIHPAMMFEAVRVLKSMGRVGSNDNDVNALKALGILQKDPIVWPYLSSETAFFIKNKSFAGPGLKVYKHRDVDATPVTWVDNATGNTYVRVRIFLGPGWSNPRAIFGSPGTAA